uniref:Uncharacterized protein n=1 Tax=viral metagenome TaxID=1070528 RepID=A0A6C0B4F7_9ZZZZ
MASSTHIDAGRIHRLKEHLARSTINHELEIMKETTLKNAHLYCVINSVSAQQYGPLLEKYIRMKNGFVKNTASKCNGDGSKDNKNAEVKVSLGGGKHDKFNYVQLRVSHDIQYYILTAYHLTGMNVETGGELYVFSVPKEDMLPLIVNHGGYAHRTNKELGKITLEDMKDDKNMKEYSMRPSYGDKCWVDLMKFRVSEDSL